MSCKHTHLFKIMCHLYFSRYKWFNCKYVYIIKSNVLRLNKKKKFSPPHRGGVRRGFTPPHTTNPMLVSCTLRCRDDLHGARCQWHRVGGIGWVPGVGGLVKPFPKSPSLTPAQILLMGLFIVIDSDRGHSYEHFKKINLRWKLSPWDLFECSSVRWIFELPEMAKN